jgi:hypothetical protein
MLMRGWQVAKGGQDDLDLKKLKTFKPKNLKNRLNLKVT